MLQAILEPVVLRREADQHAGRTPVPCDHDLFLGSLPEVLGQVIFDLRQSYLLRCLATQVSPIRRATLALRPS